MKYKSREQKAYEEYKRKIKAEEERHEKRITEIGKWYQKHSSLQRK